MKVLIIIPSYNEQECIVGVVEDLMCHGYDYIVVNDGSTDNSVQLMKENRINYLDLPFNCGIGGAVQTGYKYAYENNYDIAVQFDGDGQHNAACIEKIIAPIINGLADMVIGSRFKESESKFKSTAIRRIGIRILSRLLYKMTGRKIVDMTSGFRAVNREIIKIFAEDYQSEYPEPVSNLEIAMAGYKIEEVGVIMHERKYGKSSITALKSAYYMFNVILLFFIKWISS
ncbi:MAG: glycosyltransferase family 2 protein [Saccharofermentanales bacterium]